MDAALPIVPTVPTVLAVLAGLTLLIWLGLLLARGGFWRLRERLPDVRPATAPPVAALVPARDEAATIARTVRSVLAQNYAGRLQLVVINDGSSDGTGELARAAAENAGAAARTTILSAPPPPAGWTGKLWALETGLRHLHAAGADARLIWLCDADVVHAPSLLGRLVAQAERGPCDLVSLMVRLDARGLWGRLLVPAFVLFFRKLYPFAWVNDPRRRSAAAAGACVLVRRDALDAAGGLAAIADRIIDDCALAAAIKRHGPNRRIWLGLTQDARSLRPCRGLDQVWAMVARSAYAQLGCSPVALAGCVAGMALTYLAPPLLLALGAASGQWAAAGLAGGAWAAMALAAAPIYRFYGLSALRGLLLPGVAALYTAMTVSSAWQHRRGRGGAWKGRVQIPNRSPS